MRKWDPEVALELIERERRHDVCRRADDGVGPRSTRRPSATTTLEPSRPGRRRRGRRRPSSCAGSERAPPRPGDVDGLRPHRDVVAASPRSRGADYARRPDSVGVPVPGVRRPHRRRDRRSTSRPAMPGEVWIQRPERRARATGTGRRRRPPRSPTAGCTPATSAGSTTRIPLHRRPRQGHHHPRRREHRERRGRGRALRAPSGRRCGGLRVPAPDARRGGRCGGVCSARARPSTADELRDHVAERLAAFKVPRTSGSAPSPSPQPRGQGAEARAARADDWFLRLVSRPRAQVRR